MENKSNPQANRTTTFRIAAATQQEEDAYDYMQHRTNVKFTGLVGSVAHMVKGALGAGVLGTHVAYMKAGLNMAVPFNALFALYIGYCLHILIKSAQIMYKRTKTASMSYPDVGEAAMSCFPNPKVARFAKTFRYLIDALIILDLYGSCACYQIIIAKSLKQLVENTHESHVAGIGAGFPDLRIYLVALLIPIICICLIRHLKWLAPFSLAANVVIIFCIAMTVYFSVKNNPSFSGMASHTEVYRFFEYCGVIVFSMSCAGVVLPVENNMKNPKKFPTALTIGMVLIYLTVFIIGLFGYAGYLEDCHSPITLNFPMTIGPKILKGFIAIMIYVTHAVNFWVPFNLCFHYIKRCHKEEKVNTWELFYRAVFVILIGLVAIIFPSVDALMGFLGAFCLSNMAFIWPNFIYILVIWHRPGLGRFKWRLWRALILLGVGFFLLICGSLVNGVELINVMLRK